LKNLQNEVDTLRAKSMIGTATSEKAGFELLELEEAVKNEGGCWIKFLKAPSANPAAVTAGGKAAPPKGKPVATDDVKPIVAKAWLDLSELAQPGSCKTSIRVFLETCASALKENPDSDKYIDAEEVVPVFETERTYINFTITVSKPIVSLESTQPEP
jgi:hypothetical protein